MVKLFLSFLFCLLAFLESDNTVNINRTEAYEYAHACIDAIHDIETVRYTMAKQERVEGELSEQKVHVKVATTPLQVYMKQEYPKEGLEVLYPYGDHDKALINPNGFPWISIVLDPLGNRMREGQHHNVKRSGFDFTAQIIENLLDHDTTNLLLNVSYMGLVSKEGFNYRHIVVETDFKWINYTVQNEKSLVEVAERFHVNDYIILEHNDKVDDFEDIHSGQEIEVPNTYAKKMELFLDEQTLLPMIIKIYDDAGLYEYYRYSNVVLNSGFEENEFDRHFEAYDF